MQLMLEHVSYTYPDSPLSLFTDVSVAFQAGWTGVVGANGAGKTTLLRLAAAELMPQTGRVVAPGDVLYCPQSTATVPEALEEFALDWTADAGRLRSLLGIGDDWPWRFETLSHGERKRLQLAVVLWRRPYVLAVDEPTNHLDAESTRLVVDALKGFDGIGLIVSHDRDLLDTLVGRCAFLGSGGLQLRPGTYSEAKAQVEIERRSAIAERASAKREVGRLRAEEARRRTEADRAGALRSRARVDPGDRDAKARIGLAIVTGKDGQAGRLSAQMQGRMRRAQARLGEAVVEKVIGGDGIRLPEAASHRREVARLSASEVRLCTDRVLLIPELSVGPHDRIAIAGRNGAGKSTLIRRVAEMTLVEASAVLDIPQELDATTVAALHQEVLSLPAETRGEVLSLVTRLGSYPERILAGDALSPGEARKLMIAMGVIRQPQLILLDEPTNHLDVVATEALEDALAEYGGALVFVSHDTRFTRRLARTWWHLELDAEGVTRVRTDIAGDKA